ncbi:MAG: TIGR01777 family oxidoreductase [Cyclobacteriaceae bacterium]|nr:TIGR01777 family oxidoreductase [Cyclobacteriaceae bacterium]
MNSRIVITGGSGLIGQQLTKLLLEKGHEVSWLSRTGKSIAGVKGYCWDINKQTVDVNAFEGVSAIIHLAGEGIANKRWTALQRRKILSSRVSSTNLLYTTIKKEQFKIDAIISASGAGYYGYDNGEKELHESDKKGIDFVADVVKHWEDAVDQFNKLDVRTVKLRLGIVMTEKGGALEKMALPIRWGVGAPLGNGKQYISWLHSKDLCRMILHVINNEQIKGVYNASTSNPITNADLTKTIGKVLKRPIFLPNIPSWALRIALGEMSNLVTGSVRLSSKKIVATGFDFKFNTIETALFDLLKT